MSIFEVLPAAIMPALPLLGKLLLMVPVVPNKLIPYVLGAFNTVAKYWMLAGLPTEVTAPADPAEPTMALAGFFGGVGNILVSAVWATAEQVIAHTWYEGRKGLAKVAGKISWWEKGKASIY